MHDSAYQVMEREINALPFSSATVLDVGSFDVNGTLRPLVEARGWDYTGLDVRAGDNVDVVTGGDFRFPLADDAYDVVVSANALNFCAHPWVVVPEAARVLKPGGVLILQCVWQWAYTPRAGEYGDYWRIMPDGLQALFDLCGCLERITITRENATDLLGIAWKQPKLPPPSEYSVPTPPKKKRTSSSK